MGLHLGEASKRLRGERYLTGRRRWKDHLESLNQQGNNRTRVTRIVGNGVNHLTLVDTWMEAPTATAIAELVIGTFEKTTSLYTIKLSTKGTGGIITSMSTIMVKVRSKPVLAYLASYLTNYIVIKLILFTH
ncbi:hypothetical protein AK88_04734 [Plasmodium fragile]|uniref:Uncharacterized protein n=1 Tax=Plasmodium fragile TaxID=5857 RepID=A0A0D9QIT9_PLAFR|nr:uncharacterized protein AK88_04734 [Plasmodium fragile]KJP85621.1 hypothetical protein AK88_04734 [Plasmodium fragile]